MKEFRGRVVANGTTTAKALVSHGGLNTLASFQKALQFGDKKAVLFSFSTDPASVQKVPLQTE